MAVSTDLWKLSAGELAAAIRDRRVSSREVVQAHLERIEAVNGRVNAITSVLADRALAAAVDADRRLASGEPLGPLHGVPITVKENVDVAGTATSQGVTALAGAIASSSAPGPIALEAAGAILIARTNLPDFALRWHTDNALHGANRNPWDASRTPGGSSGGEAVALATGMTPLGIGNDLGGSLRWPSSCNGTVALKPSLGRVPQATEIEPTEGPLSLQLMSVEGPMARRVTDLRLAFEHIIAPSWRDPWHVGVPVPVEGPPAPRRVAVVLDPAGGGVDPAVARGVREAAEHLRAAGYEVEEHEPPDIRRAADTWLAIVNPDLRLIWAMIGPIVSADADRFMQIVFQSYPAPDAQALSTAFMARQALARAWGRFQRDWPLVLGPVSTRLPFPVGTDLTVDGVESIRDSLRLVVTVNVLGLPAAAVPAGMADGLPRGVQIIGPRFREDLCLDAAGAVERGFPSATPIDPR